MLKHIKKCSFIVKFEMLSRENLGWFDIELPHEGVVCLKLFFHGADARSCYWLRLETKNIDGFHLFGYQLYTQLFLIYGCKVWFVSLLLNISSIFLVSLIHISNYNMVPFPDIECIFFFWVSMVLKILVCTSFTVLINMNTKLESVYF